MSGALQSTQQKHKKTTMRLTWWRKWWRAWRVLRLLLWTIWAIYRERRRVVRAHARGHYDVQPDVDVLVEVLTAFRKTAIELGVLMIKLGQFLSTRADLLPDRALLVLSSLQDEVPPEPFDHVISVIESELGRPVEQLFSFLERKCVAAASLGQVHKGILATTGETVAVKIQRPHIDDLVHMDLSTLKFVIQIINRLFDPSDFIDLMGFYREFRRTTYEEIDYITELANAKRFKEMFGNDPTIYIPRVHEEYVSRRVLVLEWIEGIKINDYPTLDALGINRLKVASRTVEAYFHQFFNEGFFHADPHPGNIFVKKGSSPDEPVITFIDFGMVGSVSKPMKRALKDIFLGFLLRDSRTIVHALVSLGFIGEGANLITIERGMSLMMDQYYGMTLGQVREMDYSEIAHDVQQLLYDQPFQIPAQFAFTGRAVSTLVGVSTSLAPEFNLVEVAVPYARKFLGLDAAGIGQTAQQLMGQLLDAGKILLTLPHTLEQLISKIDAGQLEVQVGVGSFSRHPRRRSRRGNDDLPITRSRGGGLSLAFVFTLSLIGGIYLLNIIHQPIEGWFCLALAALTALGLIVRR
ncbi:MAG: AarF/ABC1/UbiB kinase family protein [Ktedonobacteraceae bacterium]|nr:AarF/ABC1/UbiB kinase family protein [Ktedonobacteraceae bacterium]